MNNLLNTFLIMNLSFCTIINNTNLEISYVAFSNKSIVVLLDSDSEGIDDLNEDINMNGNLNDDDIDGDLIPNYLDDDDDGDGDGILTLLEDTDGDGNPLNGDADMDSTPNNLYKW